MAQLHKFRPKYFCFVSAAIAFSIAITCKTQAHGLFTAEIYSTLTSDTIPLRKNNLRDSLSRNDSLSLSTDTLRDSLKHTDTLPPSPKIDTFSIRMSKDTLDAPVNYEAEDSAVLLVKEKMFILYGKTKTTYKDVTLTAPKVLINQETGIVTAYNSSDRLGNVATRARFQQGT